MTEKLAYRHPTVPEIIVLELKASDLTLSETSVYTIAAEYWSLPDVLTASWLESGQPPLVVVDFGGADAEVTHKLLQGFYRSELAKFVASRNGCCCLCGCESLTTPAKILLFATTKEEAVRKLLPLRQPIVRDTDTDADDHGLAARPGRICVIGCPEKDLSNLPNRLAAARYEVAVNDPRVGDPVLFCVSCADGPSQGTRTAVASCRGRTIVPLAVVLTRYTSVHDSLRELITLEEEQILSSVLPKETVRELPLMYDFDPSLVFKLRTFVAEDPAQVTCNK